MKLILGMVLFLFACSSTRPHSKLLPLLQIETASGTEAELRIKAALEQQLVGSHLETFYFSDKVLIDESGGQAAEGIVLNVHGKTSQEILDQFIVEELKYYLNARKRNVAEASSVLANLFSDIPVGAPQGAESMEANFKYILLGFWELKALEHVMGTGNAREYLTQKTAFKSIYQAVLNHEAAIRRVAENHELVIEE